MGQNNVLQIFVPGLGFGTMVLVVSDAHDTWNSVWGQDCVLDCKMFIQICWPQTAVNTLQGSVARNVQTSTTVNFVAQSSVSQTAVTYSLGLGYQRTGTDTRAAVDIAAPGYMSQSSVSQTAANTHWGSIARERGETDEQHSHVVAPESARGAVRG